MTIYPNSDDQEHHSDVETDLVTEAIAALLTDLQHPEVGITEISTNQETVVGFDEEMAVEGTVKDIYLQYELLGVESDHI